VPHVSIVIPAYNAEQYLGETLASIRAQTYDDWEIVVADDGSTDRTIEIAESFGFGARLRVVPRTGEIRGPAPARNRAIAAATGELVAFLDADDLWLPTYLERMVTLVDEGRAKGLRVGIATSDARLLGPEGFLPKTFWQLQGAPRNGNLARMLVANRILVTSVSTREAIDEAGGYCVDLFGPEDYDLWLRILELGYRVVETSEALTVYRLTPASVSTDLARMARSLQVTYERALERGRLTPRETRVARRQLRLQRALEQVGLIVAERRAGRSVARGAARSAPLFLRVAVENPDRWLPTIKILTGRGSPLSQVGKGLASPAGED